MGFIGPDVVFCSSAYVHETAYLYGKLTVEEQASIWANSTDGAKIKDALENLKSRYQGVVISSYNKPHRTC